MSSRHVSNSEEPDSSPHPRAVFTIVDTTVAPARVSVGAATQLSLATQP